MCHAGARRRWIAWGRTEVGDEPRPSPASRGRGNEPPERDTHSHTSARPPRMAFGDHPNSGYTNCDFSNPSARERHDLSAGSDRMRRMTGAPFGRQALAPSIV
ncbi:Hypothetical protein A7982_01398 [Minicystis rosea]|nr:Hypothetical protein A7982_01398 [Minicystis rosea]